MSFCGNHIVVFIMYGRKCVVYPEVLPWLLHTNSLKYCKNTLIFYLLTGLRNSMLPLLIVVTIKDAELEQQSKEFLNVFLKNIQSGTIERIDGDEWRETRYYIEEVSQKRIELGFTASDTAIFIFSSDIDSLLEVIGSVILQR